jgi:hypothetical protein
MTFYDTLKKITYSDFEIYDVYTKPFDIDVLLDVINKKDVGYNERIDTLAEKALGDDKLFWLLVLLNRETIQNLFWINPSIYSLIESHKKNMKLEPVEMIKSGVLNSINNLILVSSKALKAIEFGNITTASYFKEYNKMFINLMKNLKLHINKLPSKHDIEIFDSLEHDNLNTYKKEVLIAIKESNQIIQSINIEYNDLDYHNSDIYTLNNGYEIDSIKDEIHTLTNIMKYIVWWSNDLIDYKATNTMLK